MGPTLQYGTRLMAAVEALGNYWAPILEQAAKAHAPWTDRTGNARQTLFSVVDRTPDGVIIYLSHGMEYGVFLELCNNGKYAIVMKTLEGHYARVSDSMRRLVAP